MSTEDLLKQLIQELGFENILNIEKSQESNSHNKFIICNSANWQTSIHLALFDNYLTSKYPNKELLLSIDSGRHIIESNINRIKNFETEFINENFIFDEISSGFTLSMFDNQGLSQEEIARIKTAIKLLVKCYGENTHE